MKVAIVVQRYGAEISGGAELHARYIAELLARRHQVEVLTTCAHDYVTWRNQYPPGATTVGGITVRRFPVARERDPEVFGRRSHTVYSTWHSVADEMAWLESEGPTSPALIEHVAARADAFDAFIFFSYRYYHAWHGIRSVQSKAVLVPTAERDAAIGLALFGSLFRGVRGIMYNSPEERAMIQAVAQNHDVPGVVVGVGSAVPRQVSPERFRHKYGIHTPFVVYVGRIDANKGCAELFSWFSSYRPRLGQQLTLVLMGTSILSIPDHPRIRHLGFVPDRDKFDGIGAAEALVMPSYYESLSMVALEAWALGRPVLANGRCDVLRGQCIRSRGGLYYESFEEFAETLFTITMYPALNKALGENGRAFYERHYAWPVIDRKYGEMLARLQTPVDGMTPERLPGWIARHRHNLAPGSAVVDDLPRGPVLEGSDDAAASPPPAADPPPAVQTRRATSALPGAHGRPRNGKRRPHAVHGGAREGRGRGHRDARRTR